MATKIHLVVIDPQNSFCKVVDAAEQQIQHNGELCVPGAWDDMAVRLPEMIKRLGTKLADISVTLDSHHRLHIAHPTFWRNLANNNRPDPFTIMKEKGGSVIGYNINGDEVGEFTTVIPSFMKKAIPYLQSLETSGRYPCCIWPLHCLIGTPGHNVVAPLADALFEWEDAHGAAAVDFVTKGSNYFVEHYSAVRAEVADPEDPSTQLNTRFIERLMEADEVLLAGEARSHCLANTVRDIANEFRGDDDSFIKKCTLLTDATSDVPGFEQLGEDFVKEMTGRGMKTATTAEYLAS